MTRTKLQGIIDIEPTRSRDPNKKGQVYVVYRAPGNREPLSTSELLPNKRKAYQNIVASCKLHGNIIYTSPLIRDRTVTPERLIKLDMFEKRYKVLVV